MVEVLSPLEPMMSMTMRSVLRHMSPLPAVALLACGSGDRVEGRNTVPRSIVVEDLVRLDDASEPILARPERVSLDSKGRYFIPDLSDKNIKVYAPDGRRAGTIGRPGRGPGEFATLFTAQVYRDSLVAYDLDGARLSVFAPDGRFARSVRLDGLPFVANAVRVVDDSLFLVIDAAPGARNRPSLALVRPDGTLLSTFFAPGRYLGTSAEVLQTVFVLADASAGVVFAGVAGGDSVWTFDYRGRRLGAAAIDPDHALRTSRSLIEANGGRIRHADGSIVLDGEPTLMEIVALDSGSVAMFISRRDLTHGMDLLDGGRVIVSVNDARGRPAVVARAELDGGLMGRSPDGAPLVLRYASGEQDRYALARMRLVPVRPSVAR